MSNKSSSLSDTSTGPVAKRSSSLTSSSSVSNKSVGKNISEANDSTSLHSKTSTDIPSNLIDLNDQPTLEENRGLVHGHILPSGWTCNYDITTDEYEFERQNDTIQKRDLLSIDDLTMLSKSRDEAVEAKTPTNDNAAQTSRRPTLSQFECQYGYHFPTSPTSSMLSDLAKEIQKSSGQGPKTKQVGHGTNKFTMISDQEEQTRRLKDMFPTATGPIIDQMIRIYHGREGLIKAALISLGYKRAVEYNAQKTTAQSPIMLMMSKPASKKLFDKLISYFPDRDEALIKNLMYKHKEVEHEIISELVESSGKPFEGSASSGNDRTSRKRGGRFDKNGVMMKLRYLKFLFPTCEEIELYHLLHCNDLNTQKVIEEVEKRGHKMANIDEVMQNRKSQTQQMRAQQAALAAREKAPVIDPAEAHRNRTKPIVTEARANNLKDNLKKTFDSLEDGLLLKALEAADYNEALAKKFLEEMEPVDDEKYKQHYELHRETGPDVVLFPCKGIQKGDISFMSITAGESVAIPREVIECDHALALLKFDTSTWTQEDFEEPRITRALGTKSHLALGSIYKDLDHDKHQIRKGPRECLRIGSNYHLVCAMKDRQKPNTKAVGSDKSLCQGQKAALRNGRNPKLIQRTHPFFKNK